jgi:hypothetical protein
VGQVRDPLTDTPVAGAEVVLLDADGERPLCVTDGAGLFETPPLPDGPQRLAVLARGYIPERLTVQMPAARRALRIELTALRAEALRAYKGVVEPLAGAGAWGLRTPRDLLVALEEHPELRADQLRELTLAFEEVYFADRDLDEGTPERMRRLAKSARAGQSEAGG